MCEVSQARVLIGNVHPCAPGSTYIHVGVRQASNEYFHHSATSLFRLKEKPGIMYYKVYVGLTTGVWVEIRKDGDKGTRNNFIHELGHVIDYVVLQGGYGSFRDYHQFPEFRKLLTEKERIFGAKDDKVPNTISGYISSYARTNAQESYAVHFQAFITDRENFRVTAEQQAAEGHAELKSKYQFMERMMEMTPTTMVPLSSAFLDQEALGKIYDR